METMSGIKKKIGQQTIEKSPLEGRREEAERERGVKKCG